MQQQIIFMGDIHGEFLGAAYLINEVKNITDSIIIQVGDFGAGFHKKGYYVDTFKRLNTRLKKNNNKMFAFRGNHDDPVYFNGDWKYSNLELVPDYTVLKLGNERILCIGGAVSVDRSLRNEKTWWKDENIVFDQEKLDEFSGLTCVATHTCPSFAPPHNKASIQGFLSMDEKLAEDISTERIIVTKIFQTLQERNNVKYWIYGHFHGNHEMPKTVFEMQGVNFKFCDINELYNLNI